MTGFCLLLLHKKMCSSPFVWDFLFSQTHARLHKIARSKSRLHTYALASSLAPVGCAMWGPSPSHHTKLSEVQASVVLTEKDPPNLRSIGITLFFRNEDQLGGREFGVPKTHLVMHEEQTLIHQQSLRRTFVALQQLHGVVLLPGFCIFTSLKMHRMLQPDVFWEQQLHFFHAWLLRLYETLCTVFQSEFFVEKMHSFTEPR